MHQASTLLHEWSARGSITVYKTADLPEGQHDQVQVQASHERDDDECQEGQETKPGKRKQPSLKLPQHGAAAPAALYQAMQAAGCRC